MQQNIQVTILCPVIETEQCVVCKGWFVKNVENSCPKCRLKEEKCLTLNKISDEN
jgi:hypothetical protein